MEYKDNNNNKCKERFFIAHKNKDGNEQALIVHLNEVGNIAAQLASKIGVENVGKLIGLLHDFGKFSMDFSYEKLSRDPVKNQQAWKKKYLD